MANKLKDRQVKGIKGTWAMSELNYSNVETDVCWGAMHTLMNNAMTVLKNWKEERITK
jgi:hypothetical protein